MGLVLVIPAVRSSEAPLVSPGSSRRPSGSVLLRWQSRLCGAASKALHCSQGQGDAGFGPSSVATMESPSGGLQAPRVEVLAL